MKKFLFWLICLSLLRGLVYLLVTPPWQAPDETTHFQFMELLTQRSLAKARSVVLTIQDDPYIKLEQRILESMKKHRAWEYAGVPTPDPLPRGFWETPFFVGSSPKIYRPPLYYLMGAGILKLTHPKGLETRLYVARFYSFLLSLGTILISYFIGSLVFKDHLYALMTGAFVSFLPQFMVIGTSVNSDNLVNLLVSGFLLYSFHLLDRRKTGYDLIFIPFFLIAALFAGKTALIIFPIALFITSFQIKDLKILLLLALVSLTALLLFYFEAERFWPGLIQQVRQVIKGLYWEMGPGMPKEGNFYPSFLIMLFQTFWFAGGWVAVYWNQLVYVGIGVLCFLSLLGLTELLLERLKKRGKEGFPSNPGLSLALFAVILLFGAILTYYGMFRGAFAQGRYLFPILPVLGILFLSGLKKICPPSISIHLPFSFIFFMVGLDLYALFGCLLPYYHLG